MDKKKQFLAGHQRIGKRLVPPMMRIKNLKSISYIDHLLPELIWIGLLNQKYGYLITSRILESLFLTIDKITNSQASGNFALISSYNRLSLPQKNQIHTECKYKGILESLQNGIAPLVLLYDGCPLSFFGPPTEMISPTILTDILEKCLRETIDKYEIPGTALNFSMLLYKLTIGKIHFPSDMELPDFNCIFNDLHSEEGKYAAGIARSHALADFGHGEVDPSWANLFWNQNLLISPCQFNIGDTDA
ncbi:hypothetical protein [Geothrix sp. 21YS21S-4]|uniref:hypothetical protein n=1 Tax=Geothrix sp. 21YS21S-4 TaxID=3068889 RepID=UPI0027BB1E6D|nr:hypothetical protein [Geothrix sp. 21YS21S-4]